MDTTKPKDRIFVRDLLVRGIVGLNEWEREKKQDILINLEFEFDTRAAAISDEVERTLNYRTLTKAVISVVERSTYFLVEALAHEIARILICEFEVTQARVRVEKPGALRFARSVGVEIVRTGDDFD